MKMPTSEGGHYTVYNNRSTLDLDPTVQEDTSFYEQSGSGSLDLPLPLSSCHFVPPDTFHVMLLSIIQRLPRGGGYPVL